MSPTPSAAACPSAVEGPSAAEGPSTAEGNIFTRFHFNIQKSFSIYTRQIRVFGLNISYKCEKTNILNKLLSKTKNDLNR